MLDYGSNQNYYLLAKTTEERVAVIRLKYIVTNRHHLEEGKVSHYDNLNREEYAENEFDLPSDAKLYRASFSRDILQQLVGYPRSCLAGEAPKLVENAGQVNGYDAVITREEVVQDEKVDLKPKSLGSSWTESHTTLPGVRMKNDRIVMASSDSLVECDHTSDTEAPTSEQGRKIGMEGLSYSSGSTRKSRCKMCGREY